MPVQPTQVVEPGKTTARTIVQTVLGIAIAAGVVIPAAAVVLHEELAAWLSPQAAATLATVSAVAVAVSAIVTRIMAIPRINAWLARVGLSAGAGTVYQPGGVEHHGPAGDGVETGADGIPDVPRRAAGE